MVKEILENKNNHMPSNMPNFSRKKYLAEKYGGKAWFIICTLIVVFGAFIMVFPYLWMFLSALKTPLEAVRVPMTFFPTDPNWGIFTEAFTAEKLNFFNSMKNTLIIEVLVITVGTFFSTLCAFAFAKMNFRFKKTILIILMTSMMIPYAAVMLPQYRTFMSMGWVASDNWFMNLLPLIVPGLFGNISMTFFLITAMQTAINDAIIEEAKVEGCSWFRIYWSIGLPLARPAIAAQIIFWFVGIWNDYFAPSIYLTSPDSWTLQVAIQLLTSGTDNSDLPLLFASSFLSSIPTIIIFILCRKMFINMNANSGIKG